MLLTKRLLLNLVEKCYSQSNVSPILLSDHKNWSRIYFLRYWGTPMPIWTNGEEIICVGSINELEILTGKKVDDLHRESIDHLEIPSKIPGELIIII